MVSWILSLFTLAFAQMMPFTYMANQPTTVTYIASASNPADATTYTFNGVSLGEAHHDRYILVGVFSRSGTAQIISSLTVAGQAATLLYQNNSANSITGFYIIPLPTGTSGTVFVTFSSTMVRAGISVWQVRGLKSATAFATAALNTTNSHSTTLNIPAQGVAVGIFFTNATAPSAVNTAWTGLTENHDTFMTDVGINAQFSGASRASGVALSNQTITATTSVPLNTIGALISLR